MHGLAVIHQRRHCLSMVIWDARSTYLPICRSVSTVDQAVTLRCFESILRTFDDILRPPQGVLEHPPILFDDILRPPQGVLEHPPILFDDILRPPQGVLEHPSILLFQPFISPVCVFPCFPQQNGHNS